MMSLKRAQRNGVPKSVFRAEENARRREGEFIKEADDDRRESR